MIKIKTLKKLTRQVKVNIIRKRYKIQEVIKPNQVILVQVLKMKEV